MRMRDDYSDGGRQQRWFGLRGRVVIMEKRGNAMSHFSTDIQGLPTDAGDYPNVLSAGRLVVDAILFRRDEDLSWVYQERKWCALQFTGIFRQVFCNPFR